MDPGCNGFLLKNSAHSKDLDEAFNIDVGKTNGSRIREENRGTARCGVLDSKGRMCELEMKKAFWVPTYTHNLISVKKLAGQGAMVSHGIRHEYSAHYTAQENTKIERVCGTDTGIARCMLDTAGLPKQLWPHVLATSFYVKNRCFHSAHNSTLYEMLLDVRPNLSEMQPSVCRALVLTEDRKKMDSKTQTGIFLGYSRRSKCFIVCTEDGTPERKPRKMWTSLNVTFNMDWFPGAVTSVDIDMTYDRCVERTLHYETGLGFTRCKASRNSRRNISKHWTLG